MTNEQLEVFLEDLDRREANDIFKRVTRNKGIRGSYKTVNTGWTKYKGNLTTIVNGKLEYV